MTKHTQGPWELCKAGQYIDDWRQPFDFVKVAYKRHILCEGNSEEEANANAALITQAPDMLEALKEAKLMLQGVALLGVVGNSNCSELADRIESTINKAENKED